MKHILNNLSEQEKNAIREQHTGGMNVVTENFHRLLGSKLGDVKPLVSEQILPGLSSGNSQQSVKQVFDSCRNIPSAPTNNTNQLVDMVYRAIQGLGTDEAAIMKAFGSMGTINNFCAVNNGYRKTYGTDLYTDLDGDIDQEMEWAGISRALRNLKQVQTQGKTQKTGPGGGVKPTGGAQRTNPAVGTKPTGRVPQKPMTGATPTTVTKTQNSALPPPNKNLMRQQKMAGQKPDGLQQGDPRKG